MKSNRKKIETILKSKLASCGRLGKQNVLLPPSFPLQSDVLARHRDRSYDLYGARTVMIGIAFCDFNLRSIRTTLQKYLELFGPFFLPSTNDIKRGFTYIVLKRHSPVLFSAYFRYTLVDDFEKAKMIHLISGAGIRTHDL